MAGEDEKKVGVLAGVPVAGRYGAAGSPVMPFSMTFPARWFSTHQNTHPSSPARPAPEP